MSGPCTKQRYDVVVVGGGHNGLVAANYLARAGLSVVVLERLGVTGGAAISQNTFAGMPAKISPYAELVSLFPDQIVKDLDLDTQFRTRRTASYTPVIRQGRHTGLMVESQPTSTTADSFRALTGSAREYDVWQSFHGQLREFAEVIAPTMLEPLLTKKQMRARLSPETWSALVEEPIGHVIEKRFEDDLVRGVIATDALIGTFADLHDPSRTQNRTFLYHVVGDGSGAWKVPVGGMGALAGSLERTAHRNGAEIVTRAFVTRIDTDGNTAQVTFRSRDQEHTVDCSWVLGNVAPWVMQILLGENPGPRPEGSQIKINMILDSLPRLRSGVSPPAAFGGTLHMGESFQQLQQAYVEAAEGFIPETPPGELYCHSLTDPSVMGTLSVEGKHAFTYFGLHSPARLYSGHVEAQRDETVLRVLDVINTYLEEPIESLLALDRDGNPCLEAKAPQDIETSLAMPGGHIFHGALSWPWVSSGTPLNTPAQRWGVHTALPNVMRCGAGAVRGGAVSGIGGHNAAQAVLESVSLGL